MVSSERNHTVAVFVNGLRFYTLTRTLPINSLQEVPGLLRSAARGEVRYVALDPPSAIRRREEELKLVSIVTFVDHLTET